MPCSRKKGWMLLHFQRFQHFHSAVFSFFATNFHLFSQPCLSKRPFFSRASFSARKAAIIFFACYYAQYRMCSAVLRNHLKLFMVFLFLKWRIVLSTVEIINHRDKSMFLDSYLYRAGPLLSFRFCGCMHCACTR